MKSIRNPLALGVAVAIFGCGNGGDSAEAPVDALADTMSVSSTGEVIPITMEDRSIADTAILALAEHLDIPVTGITVDSVRSIEWSDSSIGCPQPGMGYMQVITPGHRISLRANGNLHVVHEANGNAFVCTRRKEAVSSVTSQLERIWRAISASTNL